MFFKYLFFGISDHYLVRVCLIDFPCFAHFSVSRVSLVFFRLFQLLRVVILSVTYKSQIEHLGGNFSLIVSSPHKAV